MVVRTDGVVLILLGLVLWTDQFKWLVPIHMILGIILGLVVGKQIGITLAACVVVRLGIATRA